MAVATPRKKLSEEDLYPSSDGEPMGETDRHVDVTMYLIAALRIFFADRPDIYVAGDNFIYFQEGDPKRVVSPDCYVVFGVPMGLRDTYMTWKEGGKLPSVVFEVTSRKTKKQDMTTKWRLYEQVLHVPEYFLFDPTGDYLAPRLRGYRLRDARYQEIVSTGDRLRSEQLNLDLIGEGEALRLYDPVRNTPLLTAAEQAQRASEQAQRAEAAEAEIARLRAELEALRRDRQV